MQSRSSSGNNATSASAPFEVLESVRQVKAWRQPLLLKQETVGFVPTMGNLHQGHLELGAERIYEFMSRKLIMVIVKRSLRECDHTAVSIFVVRLFSVQKYACCLFSRAELYVISQNPAQFAPNEDLANYPRTLQADIDALASVEDTQSSRRVSALFLPQVHALYPTGIQQDIEHQKGTFVDVKGFSHQMEGSSRPTFFRGVATVVTKLFNIVQVKSILFLPTFQSICCAELEEQPDWTFFGQKDIQQCFVLRQMLRDLHLPFPPSPSHLVICPTERDAGTGLALSSRNNYLSQAERNFAPVLYRALQAAASKYAEVYKASDGGVVPALVLQEAAANVVQEAGRDAKSHGIDLRLIYIAINSPATLEDMTAIAPGEGCILSGAMWLGRTRLIDNLVLNYDLNPA